MVSVCLLSDALLQHLPSHLGFSYLGRWVSLHGCSSKVQPLLLTLDEVAPPDLEHGVAPLGPPAPTQTYDYTVEVRNRFKGLDLIDTVPDQLWTEVRDLYRRQGSRPSPWKRKAKNNTIG